MGFTLKSQKISYKIARGAKLNPNLRDPQKIFRIHSPRPGDYYVLVFPVQESKSPRIQESKSPRIQESKSPRWYSQILELELRE
jgi:hypothetical protein